MGKDRLKVVGLDGSLAHQSTSLAALRVALEGAAEYSVTMLNSNNPEFFHVGLWTVRFVVAAFLGFQRGPLDTSASSSHKERRSG